MTITLHPRTVERVMRKLTSSYCQGRKAAIQRVGAVEDYHTMQYILSGDKILRSENRDAIAGLINDWAMGYKNGGIS